MHELSLAESMINTALRTDGVGADNLRVLNIKCGALSGVNAQTLEFCIQIVAERLGIENVSVVIEEVRPQLQCSCGQSYNAEDIFSECPRCGKTQHRITGGKDVFLESVEVNDGQS